MTGELAIVLLLLIGAIAMFVMNRPRTDAVALLMMAALPLSGVITINEALIGFSDPNVVLVGLMFVIGDGLVRTGVAQRLGDWLAVRAAGSETRLICLLMVCVAGLGSVMSSTGVVAIFVPIVLRIAQATATPAGKLMMPLSVAALISGMMTLVATSPNLVVNSELMRHGSSGFGFFSFTPFGVPVLIVGIFYMLFARRWLAGDAPAGQVASERPDLQGWIAKYHLAEREYRLRVTETSSVVGQSLAELDLRNTAGTNILAIDRYRRLRNEILCPRASTLLQAGDVLLIDLENQDTGLEAIRARYSLEELPLSGAYFADRSQEIGMAELIVPPESRLIGDTVLRARVRTEFGLTVVGLRRGRHAFRQGILDEALRGGDTLLVVGSWTDIQRLRSDHAELLILALPAELDDVLPAGNRAPQALACLALVVGLMVSGLVANVHAALIGCLLMGALGCINLNSSYRAVHWQSLILIIGMLPFSAALERSGGVDLAAGGLLALIGGAGIHVVLMSLFALTALMGSFISNTATAVLMAPVALALAHDLEVSPDPFAMIVALAASTAFMTPVSSPVNTLVVAPGNYSFGDFVRIGVPLSIAVMLISVVLVPWLMPP